jgi:hypothetical protein
MKWQSRSAGAGRPGLFKRMFSRQKGRPQQPDVNVLPTPVLVPPAQAQPPPEPPQFEEEGERAPTAPTTAAAAGAAAPGRAEEAAAAAEGGPAAAVREALEQPEGVGFHVAQECFAFLALLWVCKNDA